jgi:Ni,Fe-hydrogenase III large subunit/Ni,Fe-hydrogenase III component G
MPLDTLLSLLADEFPDSVGGVALVRANEVHCEADASAIQGLAAALKRATGVELWMMAAEDARRTDDCFKVHYVFAQHVDNWFAQVTVRLPPGEPAVPSLAVTSYPASRFEREIFDLFGIVPLHHPDPRPLVRHGFWPPDYFPLRWDSRPPDFADDGRPFPFGEVSGVGVYEIPVGPVHAGIIEPGHFRFSVLGETIIDLKSRLYFTHKGTEKLFEGRGFEDGVPLAERISGDSSVAHALAFCQAIERAAAVAVPPRAEFIRVVLLELERLYNHINDFGAVANDTGFALAHAHCLRLREQLLRLNKQVTGHRLLRGVLCPGGVRSDLPGNVDVAAAIAAIIRDFDEIVAITMANTLVLDRLRDTGRLAPEIAADHQVLGVVARASGIDRDVRRDHPFAAYDRLTFAVPVHDAGDVEARVLVRVGEVHESASLVRQALSAMPAGSLSEPVRAVVSGTPGFSSVEGWRGAITHWVSADDRRLLRVKVVDPSFLNWRALSYAVLDNIVPDFPLCNKSFNQSYSGNDL